MDFRRSIRRTPLLVALLAAFVPYMARATAPASLACGGWSVVPGPSPFAESSFSGVAADSPTDAWAVGGAQNIGLAQNTVIAHWNGTSWLDATPVIRGYLDGVTALSPTNAWAVGETNRYQTLIVHWDGTKWTVIPSPNSSQHSNILVGVAAVSPRDIWAVGYGGLSVTLPQSTLIEHWNGTQWHIIPSPNGGTSNNTLAGVTVVSSTDVWAVGYYFNTARQQDILLTEHWNGAAWSIVPAPGVGEFTSVASTDARHVWAAGYHTVVPTGGNLIEQWNGATWRGMLPTSQYGFLYGIAASSPTNAWSVGGGATTVTMHWDGTQWTVVSSPNGTYDYSQLNGVAIDSSGGVWAVGDTYGTAPQVGATLIEHYC